MAVTDEGGTPQSVVAIYNRGTAVLTLRTQPTGVGASQEEGDWAGGRLLPLP